ncbi:MAG TPA: lysophospholipid acyltransferase family protein [Kiritimatiellia bacterium]|nr:lysophospholipid acyltransferase family protein [Kiritimatiellia bacterium]
MAGYLSYQMASGISRTLPARAAYWVGLRIADLHYLFNRRAREAVRGNIRQVFLWRGIQPARRALRGHARKTFQHFGKYLVDFFRFTNLTARDLEERVSIEHPERLAEAVRRGRGVVVVTAHFGNWEIGGAVLHALGYPVNAVVAPERLPRLERLLRRQRERRGLHVVQLGQSARALLRSLQRGEIVALLADRDFSSGHRVIELFGKRVCLPRGAAWLARRAGAPVVPVFLIRQEDDTFLLRIHPPIPPDLAGGEEATMRSVRDSLEREIGERPYQWFLFHDFWKPEPARSA